MTEWNYLMMGEPSRDWNQTLVTMLNACCDNEEYPKQIKVPKKFRPIIESLYLYNDFMIGDRYLVDFIDDDTNQIIVNNNWVNIINYGSTES